MTNDKLLRGFKAAMSGATPRLKADLQSKVDAETYQAISREAIAVLERLPRDIPLGTMAAALMLAATAFAEGASQARALIEAKE